MLPSRCSKCSKRYCEYLCCGCRAVGVGLGGCEW